MPEGCAEELDEAGAGELVAVSAFELAVVEEEIAGDAHAQGHLASPTPGYLDSFVRCLVFGTPGYLDSGALIARALARGSVALFGSGAFVVVVVVVVVGGFGQTVARDAS